MIGKTINNYVIERKLGDGGMGEVFYAKHNKVDREVAIKVLHSHLFSNENIHNRFKNEANALIKLNHPNIVKIFDYVEQDNFACLIMEYINGYTLDDYISKVSGPLPSAKASSIICSILDAVQYAHDHNVYHRDIKPANIMISKDGNKVRIMDFGIAKLTDSKNFKTTHANTQLGTPFYMSPEQIKGLPYSRMSDIYSLGVTLFEMVTGKCPYHQITSLFELQSKIVNEPLPHTSDYYPGVNIRIQNAIIKATQKAPEQRFQNCNEFKMYLQDKEAFNLTTIALKPLAVKQPKENLNWLMYLIAGLAGLLVIVLAFVYMSKNPSTTLPPESGHDSTSVIQVTTVVDTNNKAPINHPKTTSVQDQNLVMLNTYLDKKQKETNTKLNTSQIELLKNEIQTLTHLISATELSVKYDYIFVPKPTVKLPSNSQIAHDFLNELHQRGIACRTKFENDNQISGINIVKSNFNSYNPPNKITYTVNYTIASVDDESETTTCSIILKYSKSGNEYELIR